MKILLAVIILTMAASFSFAQTNLENRLNLMFKTVVRSDLNTEINPLRLSIEVKKDGAIKLNAENAGQLNDPTTLIARLSSILAERKNAEIYREGTNQVESTTRLRVDRDVDYGQVAALIGSLRQIGVAPLSIVTGKTNTVIEISDESKSLPASRVLTISISDNGNFNTGNNTVSVNSSAKNIAEQAKIAGNLGFVLIKASSKVKFGSLTELFDAIGDK